MVTDKYLYETNQGYHISQAYFYPNTERGFGPDSTVFVIVKRPSANDYVVGKDYNSAKGYWEQGSYGFKSLMEATRCIKNYDNDRTSYRVNLKDLYYVVGKGNRNQLDNYGIYNDMQKALKRARKLVIGNEHPFEIKQANGEVLAILTEIQKDVVTAYFPHQRVSAVISANGSIQVSAFISANGSIQH